MNITFTEYDNRKLRAIHTVWTRNSASYDICDYDNCVNNVVKIMDTYIKRTFSDYIYIEKKYKVYDLWLEIFALAASYLLYKNKVVFYRFVTGNTYYNTLKKDIKNTVLKDFVCSKSMEPWTCQCRICVSLILEHPTHMEETIPVYKCDSVKDLEQYLMQQVADKIKKNNLYIKVRGLVNLYKVIKDDSSIFYSNDRIKLAITKTINRFELEVDFPIGKSICQLCAKVLRSNICTPQE